jgi:hypothetical protein
MPQPGSTPIILYHTTTAAAAPSAGNLSAGELAINVTDKKIYSKDGGGAVVQVAAAPGANADITSLSGLTTPLSIAQGGTAATTAAGARTSLLAVGYTTTTGSAAIPAGTTGQQDGSPTAGYFRFNTTTVSFEGYNGTVWGAVGGGNSTTKGMWVNSQTINEDITVTTGNSATSTGPITIAAGKAVTLEAGVRWMIL